MKNPSNDENNVLVKELIESFLNSNSSSISEKTLKITKEAFEQASKVYYEGNDPLVTDEVFDKAIKKYEKLTGEKITSGYNIKSSSSAKKLVDTEHRFPDLVGTLDKVNTIDEFFNEWLIPKISKCRKNSIIKTNIPLVISDKEDGNSVVGTFDANGNSVQWLTRGRDGIGLDLTSLFSKVSIPVNDIIELSHNIGEFGIKFEAVMTDENLEKYAEKSGKTYANSRSAVAGILSAKDGKKWIKYVQLVPLRIQTADPEKQMSRTYEFEAFKTLCRLNSKKFLMPKYSSVKIGLNKGEYIIEEINGANIVTRESFVDYMESMYRTADIERNQIGSRPKDGLVIEFANKRDRELLGRDRDRNHFDVALKFPYQVKETTVEDIEFYVGKTGRITPVVIFKPLIFNGATCDHVSIANYKRFKELNLYKGCKVNIEYRNDVLCYLTRLDFNMGINDKPFEFINKCPICDSNVVLNDKETFAYCENEKCPGRQIGKITNWLLKLGIKGINEKTIETLIRYHLLNDIDDLYKLKKEDIKGLEGFKEKSSKKIIELINSRKEIYDYEMLGSLNIEGISLNTTKEICRKINIDQILELNKSGSNKLKRELVKIKNISDITAETFINGLNTNLELIERLMNILTIKPSLKLKDGKEFNVVFSGFRNKELERAIEEKGWCYKNSISSKTNLLVVLDAMQGTTKIKKALELGVKVINYDDFIKEYIEAIAE